MYSITTWRNATAKWLSECLSVQMTNTRGKWCKVTGTAFISISTTLEAQRMAVLPNSMFSPPVGRWAQQDLLIGRRLRWEVRWRIEICSTTWLFFHLSANCFSPWNFSEILTNTQCFMLLIINSQYVLFSLVQFSHSIVSHSLRPPGLQHTRLRCPPPPFLLELSNMTCSLQNIAPHHPQGSGWIHQRIIREEQIEVQFFKESISNLNISLKKSNSLFKNLFILYWSIVN